MQVTLLNNVTIPVGTSTSGTINVPGTVQAKTVTFTLDATNYVDGTTLDVAIEISFDAGATWQFFYGFGITERGLALDGSPAATWSTTVIARDPMPAFLARAKATVAGHSLKTTVVATVT